jgi:hypothetical protein
MYGRRRRVSIDGIIVDHMEGISKGVSDGDEHGTANCGVRANYISCRMNMR